VARERGRVAWRRAFWAYAVALFTVSHWPAARLPPMVIERPDLIVHVALFAGWSFLLTRTGYLGRPGSWRASLLVLPVALAYAGIDEALQAVPVLRRTAVWSDAMANCAGVILGVMLGRAVPAAPGRGGAGEPDRAWGTR